MPENKNYSLMVGRQAAERLILLNQICNPYTLNLLENLGTLTGKRILDLGCGTGIMTCELAKLVGETGFVTAVDISPEQLTIAKENAKLAGIKNVEFIELPANDINKLSGKFDLIYSRFLFAHLDNPLDVFNKLIPLLMPNAYVVQEEPHSYEVAFSYPHSDVFDIWKKVALDQAQLYKRDFYLGAKLNSIYQKLGLTVLELRLIQPILRTKQQRQHLWISVKELSHSLIKHGLRTQDTIDKDIKALQQFVNDDQYIFGWMQYMQIVGMYKI